MKMCLNALKMCYVVSMTYTALVTDSMQIWESHMYDEMYVSIKNFEQDWFFFSDKPPEGARICETGLLEWVSNRADYCWSIQFRYM